MKLSRIVPVLLAVAAPPAAAQQRVAHAFATAAAPRLAPAAAVPVDTVPVAAPARPSRGARTLGRAGYAVLGWAAGLAAGGLIGLAVDQGTGGDPEWDGLVGVVVGAGLGSVAGAGIGAAVPRYGSPCSFGRRLGNGLLGSLGGTIAGAAVASSSRVAVVGAAVPLGSSGGAAVAVGCWGDDENGSED